MSDKFDRLCRNIATGVAAFFPGLDRASSGQDGSVEVLDESGNRVDPPRKSEFPLKVTRAVLDLIASLDEQTIAVLSELITHFKHISDDDEND